MTVIQLNPESKQPYFLGELHHITTAIHVIAGFLFCGLSGIHVIKNWKALKNHFNK
jgi:hypothetical protein